MFAVCPFPPRFNLPLSIPFFFLSFGGSPKRTVRSHPSTDPITDLHRSTLVTMASDTGKFEDLLEPLRMGDLHLKNRVAMASLTRNRDNVPRENLHVPYYRERAGTGLILSEAALICPQGVEWTFMPGIYSDEHVEAWQKVTTAVHQEGGLIFCQLHHVGRVAHPDTRVQREIAKPVPGPSAVAARGGKFRNVPGSPGYVQPTPIENPWEIVELYGNAARLAREAGFDGVELHNANGYLPMQFLESHSNRRTD